MKSFFEKEIKIKNIESNVKNLKVSLKELLKMNNFNEIDNLILMKVKNINLNKSNDEIIYLIKSFINHFIELREDIIYQKKEIESLITERDNYKVEIQIEKREIKRKRKVWNRLSIQFRKDKSIGNFKQWIAIIQGK